MQPDGLDRGRRDEATVIHPPTQAADGIQLACLIAQGQGLSDLVQVEVPKRVGLNAPVVSADNGESAARSTSYDGRRSGSASST